MTALQRIRAMDEAALTVARHTQAVQPNAKFLGNLASAAAPLLGTAAMLFPATAPLGLAAKIAGGVGMLNNVMGGGGGGGQPQQSNSPLGNLIGAVGPAIGANVVAKNDYATAQQLTNDAYNRQNAALTDALKQYQTMISGAHDPSFGMLRNTQFTPIGNLQTASAPQIQSLWNGNASQVPQLGSYNSFGSGVFNPYLMALQRATQPQINFGGFNGSFAPQPTAQQPGAQPQPSATAQPSPWRNMQPPSGIRTMPVGRMAPMGLGAYAGGYAGVS